MANVNALEATVGTRPPTPERTNPATNRYVPAMLSLRHAGDPGPSIDAKTLTASSRLSPGMICPAKPDTAQVGDQATLHVSPAKASRLIVHAEKLSGTSPVLSIRTG